MIFDLDRERTLARVEARSFWNGPAFENALQFEAEVVVQPGGGVFLHDEQVSRSCRANRPGRLRRSVELSLALVISKSHVADLIAPGAALLAEMPGVHPVRRGVYKVS
jgi:hypothetical protein